MPLNIRLLIYISQVRALIEYGIITAGDLLKVLDYIKLKSSKKAVSAVNNKNFRSHSKPIFSQLKILDDIYLYFKKAHIYAQKL